LACSSGANSRADHIWFDAGGDLLVADYDGDAIKRFGPDAVYKGVFIRPGQPEGVAELPAATC